MIVLTQTDMKPLKFTFSQFGGFGYNKKLNYHWVKVCCIKHPVLENKEKIIDALHVERDRIQTSFNFK